LFWLDFKCPVDGRTSDFSRVSVDRHGPFFRRRVVVAGQMAPAKTD